MPKFSVAAHSVNNLVANAARTHKLNAISRVVRKHKKRETRTKNKEKKTKKRIKIKSTKMIQYTELAYMNKKKKKKR